MTGVMFLGLIILVVIVIIGVPVGLSFLILYVVRKGNYDRRLRSIALIPILTIGYFIYTAFFPTDSFYEEDFEEVTGVKFPDNGEIIYKTATYPDHFGDYGSTSLIKVDKTFFKDLEEQIKTKGLADHNEDSGPINLQDILEEIGTLRIEKEFSMTVEGGKFYYVGFLSDKETLIVQRQSW